MKKLLLIPMLLFILSCTNDDTYIEQNNQSEFMFKHTFKKTTNYTYPCYEENPSQVLESISFYSTELVVYNESLINTEEEIVTNTYYYTFGGCNTWEGKIRLIESDYITYSIY